jgi:Na+-transporting NADH:ubiquinone oxidoreductase subunit NqrA
MDLSKSGASSASSVPNKQDVQEVAIVHSHFQGRNKTIKSEQKPWGFKGRVVFQLI